MAEENLKLFTFHGSFIAEAEAVKARKNEETVDCLKWDRYRYISEVRKKKRKSVNEF
jgi:hypothetical protein